MLREDYLMRQIEGLARTLARLLFEKDTAEYRLPEEVAFTETDLLYRRLEQMVKEGEINQAEDLLFERLDTRNPQVLEVALAFYDLLNGLEDDFLEKNQYEREEIQEGLQRALELYDVQVPGIFL